MADGDLTPAELHDIKLAEERARIAKEEEANQTAAAARLKTAAETEKLKKEADAAAAKAAAETAQVISATQIAAEKAADDKATREREAVLAQAKQEAEKKKLDLETKAAERADRIAEDEADEDAAKRQADRRKSIAEAEKAVREAMFPRGETKPLEGTTEVDAKAGYLADLVAHKALEECAKAIGTAIDGVKEIEGKDVLLVETLDFSQGDVIRLQTVAQIESFITALVLLEPKLETLFTKPLPLPAPPAEQPHEAAPPPEQREGFEAQEAETPAVGGRGVAGTVLPGLTTGVLATLAGVSNPVTLGLTAAVSGVSLAADVAGYFLTDYSIKGRDLAISTETVLATVAGGMSKPHRHIFGFRRIAASTVMEDFVALLEEQLVLAGQAERVRLKLEYTTKIKDTITELLKTAAKAEKPGDKASALAQAEILTAELKVLAEDVGEAEAAYQIWKTTSAALEAFAKTAVTVPAGSKLSPLAMSALMESLSDPSIEYLLWVKAGSAGSELMTQRSRFPWWNARNTYFGGVTVSYVLAEKKGAILAAGTETAMRRLKYSLADGAVHNSGAISLEDVPSRRQGVIDFVKGVFTRKSSEE